MSVRRRGRRLLLLQAAEKQIEQAFGGSRARGNRNQAREYCRGDKHHAAPHALMRKLCTQRLLHPTQRTLPKRSNASAPVTLVRDGKRAVTARVGRRKRNAAGAHANFSSWPGLSPPSTLSGAKEGVDGRHEARHDGRRDSNDVPL